MRQLEMIVGEQRVSRRPARVPEDVRVRQRDVARSGAHPRRADAGEPRRLEPRVGRGARPAGVHDGAARSMSNRDSAADADDARIRWARAGVAAAAARGARLRRIA